MGFREAVFLGFVFLFSGGNLLSSSSSSSSLNTTTTSTHESRNRTPAEPVTPSPQLQPDPQRTEGHQSDGSERPLSYRLRSHQLRGSGPTAARHEQSLLNSRNPEAREPTSEELERKEAWSLLHPGPELNPPLPRETKVQVKLEQRVPVPANSVSVHCGERRVIVEVNRNFLGNGQLIRPTDLALGGCSALDTAGVVLQFHAEIHECGSTLKMTDEELVYTFTLTYTPAPITSTFILKTNPSEVQIQCLYPRRHQVSSSGMRPTWNHFATDVGAKQQLRFSLRFMTEDWRSPRPSSVHFLSDVMHIEASVLQGHHAPLRVYVDRCVATVDPDPASHPRYSFISDHGCFTDAKLTGAKSYFMQRSHEDQLHFQLQAFRFFLHDAKSFYITCHLRATLASVPVGPQRKACSYMTEAQRWVASDGDNRVCSCCETSCSGRRRRRSLLTDDALQWEGTAALGPIPLREDVRNVEPTRPSRADSRPRSSDVSQLGWDSSMALLGGVGAALALLFVFSLSVMRHRPHGPRGYSVPT